MIESVKLINGKEAQRYPFHKHHDFKITVDTSILELKSVTIQFEFSYPIKQLRDHSYRWVDIKKSHIANWYSPKILKLENGQLVQANQQIGIWEIKSSQKNILLWHLNPRYSKPLAQYDSNNSKHIVDAFNNNKTEVPLGLLFVKDYGLEISRSQVPFSAVTCFTDHCDFDTINNLKKQREFFKKYGIKLTKGIFINHFSKHKDTASFEHHSDEYKNWLNDGHELAYHSLSQSIKPLPDSLNDFQDFKPPLESIHTYIDHGFQQYNLSQFSNYEKISGDYGSFMSSKFIQNFWNYVDTGTSVRGVINQINPDQFTLENFTKGIAILNRKTQVSMFIKNTIFHYFNNDYSLRLYRYIARYFKTIKSDKSLNKHVHLVINGLKLIRLFVPIALFWSTRKKSVYPLAKYAPLIFEHTISGKTFTIFQTLEMIDFKLGLCQDNLDLLIDESGLFIAHTYFSAPMNYHRGKLFGKIEEIDAQVEKNFAYLSQKINSKEIWNPTLVELIDYLKQFDEIMFDCDARGKIIAEYQNKLEIRKVS